MTSSGGEALTAFHMVSINASVVRDLCAAHHCGGVHVSEKSQQAKSNSQSGEELDSIRRGRATPSSDGKGKSS